MMLLHADQKRALEYLSSCIDQVTSFGDILQLIIVELIYKVRFIATDFSVHFNFRSATPIPPSDHDSFAVSTICFNLSPLQYAMKLPQRLSR